MAKAVSFLARVLHFLLYNIELIAICHAYPVNLKLIQSHPTVTENPEMLLTFGLRKEFKTFQVSTR